MSSLNGQEKSELEISIEQDGITEPITVWHDQLVDGHHRLSIAKRLKIDYPVRVLDASWSEAQAVEWAVRHQLGRRNLDRRTYQRLWGRLYNARKAEHGGVRPGAGRPKNTEKTAKGQAAPLNSALPDAADEIAAEAGVDERTVRRWGAREEIVDALPKAIAKHADELSDKQLKRLDDCEDIQAVDRALRVGQADTVADAYQQATGRALPGAKAKPKEPDPAAEHKRNISQLVSMCNKVVDRINEMQLAAGGKNEHAREATHAIGKAIEFLKGWT